MQGGGIFQLEKYGYLKSEKRHSPVNWYQYHQEISVLNPKTPCGHFWRSKISRRRNVAE
jgi:hypothetical protein